VTRTGRTDADRLTGQLKVRLQERHADDVFALEALAGPGGAMRFDGWGMKPSWVETRCWGYEVKVSRSDFTGDRKWQHYLDFCTHFYFVCPANLIRPEELPHEIGLLWSTSTGNRIYQKKAAVPRPISDAALATMLRHVLMWRYSSRQETRRETAERWMADRADGTDFAYKMRQYIRGRVAAETDGVRRENERLQEEHKTLLAVRGWMMKNGIRPEGEWTTVRKLDEATRALKAGLSEEMSELANELMRLSKAQVRLAETIRGKKGVDDEEG
jgi:hypothetical protein